MAKVFSIMYWLPTFIGSRFTVASKTCSTKPLSNSFKVIKVENFINESHFYSRSKSFGVYKISFKPLIY